MLVVLLVAVVLGAEATRRRWASFKAMAKDAALREDQCRAMAGAMRWAHDRGPAAEREESNAKAEEYNRLAEECARMRIELARKW